MTAITPRTETEADELGWTVDRHVDPWVAYLGPRFAPDRLVEIDTPAWSKTRSERVAAAFDAAVASTIGADIVEPVEDAVTRGAIPHDPRECGRSSDV